MSCRIDLHFKKQRKTGAPRLAKNANRGVCFLRKIGWKNQDILQGRPFESAFTRQDIRE
jgi:hypothetical protein